MQLFPLGVNSIGVWGVECGGGSTAKSIPSNQPPIGFIGSIYKKWKKKNKKANISYTKFLEHKTLNL